MGRGEFGPLQYVDDDIAVCPSAGSAKAVVQEGNEAYAYRFRAKFHYGDTKSAVMPLFDSPVVDSAEMGFPVVWTYMLLGILLDSQLCLEPMMAQALARSHKKCLQLFYAAETAGFSVPVEAVQVPLRIEPLILYAAELYVEVPEAERALNRTQEVWAKRILGCRPMFAAY